jgi:hypothetical protein
MLLQPKVAVGGMEVLVSGTVVSYGFQYVDIHPIANTPYHVRIFYEPPVPGGSPSLAVTQVPNETQVRLTNFDYQTGIGTSAPIYIADWLGRRLYLSLVAHLLGAATSGTRVLHYTIHNGEAAHG